MREVPKVRDLLDLRGHTVVHHHELLFLRGHETKQAVCGADALAFAGRRQHRSSGLTEACRLRGALVLVDLVEHRERVAYVATRAADENRRALSTNVNLLEIPQRRFRRDLSDDFDQLSTTLGSSIDGVFPPVILRTA